jgi:Mn-containing catalase
MISCSIRGDESAKGRWANGPSMDGLGYFNYVHSPVPHGDKPFLKPAPPYIHDTLPQVLKADVPPRIDEEK